MEKEVCPGTQGHQESQGLQDYQGLVETRDLQDRMASQD